MRLRFAAPLLAAVLVAACGGKSGPAQTQVVPSTPTGTVWGEVVDASGQTPLSGVSVSLAVGESAMTAKTGTDGTFKFTNVPAGGRAAVTLTMKGYTQATVAFNVPATAGNFPVDGSGAYVGPIALFPATGVLHVQVVGYDGTLIDGAAVTATAGPAYVNLGGPGNQGMVTVSGKTSGGTVDLSGLQDLETLSHYGNPTVQVMVAPVSASGGGGLAYLGQSVIQDAASLAQAGGEIIVTLPAPGGSTPLQAISSNVGSIFDGGRPQYGNSMVAAAGPVRVVYNQPVDPATVVPTVQDDSGKAIPVTAKVTQGNVVEVTANSNFTAGGAYWFQLRARAAGTGSGSYVTSVAGWFFVPVNDTKPTVASVTFIDNNANGLLDAPDAIRIDFDRAIGGDGNNQVDLDFYLNVDLDNSGKIGDAPFEAGSGMPLLLRPIQPPVGASLGLVRDYVVQLAYVPPSVGYSFTTNTNVSYVIDYPAAAGAYDAQGQPLQETQAQAKVTFGP